ncbi:MAG: Uma2 family endonuclease [Gemmataceae bacterium]
MNQVLSPPQIDIHSDELFALPPREDLERYLIAGELRELPMTLRTPWHAGPTAVLTMELGLWCRAQSAPRPMVFNGDVYFRLRQNPDTNVGVDVAIATATQVAALTPRGRYLEGAPLLAVEVLSGSDTMELIDEKVAAYLEAGTPMVWIVDPTDRTVTVYRPGVVPEAFNTKQLLQMPDLLPGFELPVTSIFISG